MTENKLVSQSSLDFIIDGFHARMSQKKVAEFVKVSQQSISQWFERYRQHHSEKAEIVKSKGFDGDILNEIVGYYATSPKVSAEVKDHCIKLLIESSKVGFQELIDRMAGVDKSQALIQTFKLPTSFPEALRALASAEEEKELLKESLDGYRNLFSGNSTLSMKQASDAFNIPTLGQNNLIKYLRKKGMMCSKGSSPTQVAKDRGYLEIEPSEWEHNGKTYSSQKGVLTWKGFCWLVTQLRTDGYSIRQSPQSMWDIYYPPTNNQLASGN